MFGLNRRRDRVGFPGPSSSTRRGPRRRDRGVRPTTDDGRLEPRIVLSHATVQVGAVSPGLDTTFAGRVARRKTVDYQFQVTSSTIVGVTLSGLSSNAELVLKDANKNALATFSNGKGDDSFTYTFAPGTYEADVAGMARRKARYHLEVMARAVPAPSSSTTAPNSAAGGSKSSTGSGSQGGSGSSTGSASAADIEKVIQQTIAGMENSINQFVNDAGEWEIVAPTLMAGSGIDRGIIQVAADMADDQPLAAFADLQALGSVAFQEAYLAIAEGIPYDCLLANSQLVDDLVTVNDSKQQTYAMLQAVASQEGLQLSSYARSVMSTGVLAPPANAGQYSGVVSTPTVTGMTTYSTPALDSELDSY